LKTYKPKNFPPKPRIFQPCVKPLCDGDVTRYRRRNWSRYFVYIQTSGTRQSSASETMSTATYRAHWSYQGHPAYDHKMYSTSSTVRI